MKYTDNLAQSPLTPKQSGRPSQKFCSLKKESNNQNNTITISVQTTQQSTLNELLKCKTHTEFHGTHRETTSLCKCVDFLTEI